MDIAAQLRREATAANERRMLVVSGSPEQTRASAIEALRAADIPFDEAVSVGGDIVQSDPALTQVPAEQYRRLLGSTWEAAIVNCHDRCEPNVLGGVTGTVAGGGLLILCTPPFEQWVGQRDSFDETLAVPPYSVTDVGNAFRTRLVETLTAHRGIAIVDAESGTVRKQGLTNPQPRLDTETLEPPSDRSFPDWAYTACLTGDQQEALLALEGLTVDETAIVVEADRGRGKSSVAGIASAALAKDGADVLVTAPERTHVAVLFERAAASLESSVDMDIAASDSLVDTDIRLPDGGQIRYEPPHRAESLPDDPDCVIVDEAAGIPVGTLTGLLSCDRLAFLTTVHGYEGTGRGFAVRFRERLDESRHTVTDVVLSEPVRYAPADPVELWSFRALCLYGRPPAGPAIADATSESVTFRTLSSGELTQNEQLLQEVFGLLVLAHYHTEPNDLARLLDAPNVSVHALLFEGHPVSVALVAEEGGLSDEVCAAMYEGERVRGNLIPDLLASQLRDESAPTYHGRRILRIATHESLRSHGFGSQLLAELRERAVGDSPITTDWLGVSFGATPRLVSFWAENGYRTIHLSTSQNDRSGEHSALMIDPLTEQGHQLLSRHTDWFFRRFPATLVESLSGENPDTIRAVCRATEGQYEPNLSPFEWKILTGIGNGAAIFETAPEPIRQLSLQYLTDAHFNTAGHHERPLSATEERLLVMKSLQARPWDTVREELKYDSTAAVMRSLGSAVDTLVTEYGDPTIQTDRERLRK